MHIDDVGRVKSFGLGVSLLTGQVQGQVKVKLKI